MRAIRNQVRRAQGLRPSMKERLLVAEHLATSEKQAHGVTLDLLNKKTREARKLRHEIEALQAEKATPSSQRLEGASTPAGGEGGVVPEALKAA